MAADACVQHPGAMATVVDAQGPVSADRYESKRGLVVSAVVCVLVEASPENVDTDPGCHTGQRHTRRPLCAAFTMRALAGLSVAHGQHQR